jgi:hypothetical protein
LLRCLCELGCAEEIALHISNAGSLQELGRPLIAHPFADGDDAEILREIDQRAHEHLVLGVGGGILDERAVDLDHVDAEQAERAE